MMRDLQTTTLKYQEIKSKQMEAELSQNLETERKGERYTLVEPPILPDSPVSPNRILILILGVILSVVGAIAAAVVIEMLDDAVKGKEELTEILGAAPLATITYLTIAEEERTVSKRQKFGWAALAAGLVLVLILIDSFYKPLDVLWFVLLHKLGLGY
jgi:succinoglycan biosynthesis transport protein ExoP